VSGHLSFRSSLLSLKIGLCVSVCVSLICRFSSYVLYMWYRSHVFISGPFFLCVGCPLCLLLCRKRVVRL
jgi:hypothetical protein